ncbi:MAG: hypothetical protein IJ571_00220 [Ruminococcus sp.]|nr:hypothetical protein [Ruminococcus sp.]
MPENEIMYTGYDAVVLAQTTRPSVLTLTIPSQIRALLGLDKDDCPLSFEEYGEFIHFKSISEEEIFQVKIRRRKAACCDMCGATEDVTDFMNGHICSNCIKILSDMKGVV